jgi:hypothetical protein
VGGGVSACWKLEVIFKQQELEALKNEKQKTQVKYQS